MAKTHTPKDDDEEKIMKENIQKRFKAMFSGKGEPLSNISIQEVEVLKGRVAELEDKLAQQGTATLKTETFEVAKVPANQPLPPRPVAGTPKPSASNFVPNALRISQIGFVASIITASFYLYLALQFGAWQLYAWSADIWILALVGLINIILVRRGHADRAMWLLIAAISITFIGAVALIEGIGLLLGVSIVALIPIIAGQTLPPRAASRAIIFGVVSGVAAVLLDLLLPEYRFPRPEPVRVFLPIILGVVILLFGYVTIRQFRDYSLRTKMIIVFTITVVSTLGIAAFLTNRGLTASLTEDIGNSLAALANSKAIEIGQTVDRESDLVKALVLGVGIQEVALQNNADLLSQTDLMRLETQWQTANAVNDNGDPLASRVIYNSASSELRRFRDAFPQHLKLLLTNRQGVSIAATDRPANYYQGDEEWWQTAYQEGLYISQPEYNENGKTIVIEMAVRMRDNLSGKFLGILHTTVDFSAFSESLIAGQFGQTGSADIYLPNGQELSLQIAGDGSRELVLKEAEFDINRLAQSTAPYMEIAHDGVPTLASQALATVLSDEEEDVKAIDNLNWSVVVHQNQAEALQPVTIQTRNTLVIVVVVSLAVILIAYVLARWITTPLIDLTNVAGKIAAGDLTARAKVETQDEIGMLATTFNNMTAQVGELFGSMEQRVLERTHDLELATEVGRAVSEKVGDLSELLSQAVEMIRARFNLYYTQIYLTDPSGKIIVLRAGTGEVGRELLHKGHQLTIDSGSLNGRAALEKRAVIVADTKESPTFLPNALLPTTRSEMSIPLIVGGKVVGVLDMQSEQPGALNETNLPAFEALAGQLAIAVQNAALFAQAEEARATVEAQIRHLTEQGWQDFLDAIDRGEKIGFEFKKSQIVRLEPEALLKRSEDQDRRIPITVTGATIGEISLPVEQDHTWTPNEQELIKVTSAQLAQHIENLRLLAQAERFRAEAEQALRRLTRQGWDTFLQSHTEFESGYAFDLTQVKPLAEAKNGHSAYVVKQPIVVGDQPIGELGVDMPAPSEEATEVLTAVAEQLSGHIENLRLSELNERHAQREQTLRQITSALRTSNNPVTIMRTAVRELGSILGRRTVVQLVAPEDTNQAASDIRNDNGSGIPAHES